MSDIEAQRIAARIDTVLDILVAGDSPSRFSDCLLTPLNE